MIGFVTCEVIDGVRYNIYRDSDTPDKLIYKESVPVCVMPKRKEKKEGSSTDCK